MPTAHRIRSALLSTTALLWPLIVAAPALAQTPALPSGGAFVAGSGAIAQSGATLTITQGSTRGIIHWRDFSIGAGGTVRFDNGSGATLNRVTGGSLSEILGSLNATGTLYLINPQGVVIGRSGAVVTGGSFVASTRDVADAHFLAGGSLLFKNQGGASTGSVTNLGKISATGGDVVLIAREVVNTGAIEAPKGTAALVSASEVLLNESGDGERVFVRVANADGGGKVETSGRIKAAQVELKAAGGNVYALAGNNGGLVRATGTVTREGRVWLSASAAADNGGAIVTEGKITAKNADGSGGRIDVSAPDGMLMHTGALAARGASGGTVSITADRVVNQGRISADGRSGKGGRVAVTATTRYIDTSSARTSANGKDGAGGAVSLTGLGTLYASGKFEATGTTVGGRVDLFADEIRLVGATVNASGGTGGGGIRVGGDYQGSGDAPHAQLTLVTPATSLAADARDSGTGGRIVVWSDGKTTFAGAASARGGAAGGDGGLVEVSSKDSLLFAGTVDAGATAGLAGTLLLDPKNITISDAASYPQFELIDPAAASGNNFGGSVSALSGGNIVVTATGDSTGGTGAGAVYLFNGATGALISTLNGTSAGDAVGSRGVTVLSNGNYVVASSKWKNGTASSAGAVTWGNGVSGVAGVVSASNSLVGAATSDQVGTGGVTALTNGNYVVGSQNWKNGAVASAGAATWGSGTGGLTGAVSATNSLVGASSGDQVGYSVTALPNGNYVVVSQYWKNGAAASAGAATWGSGAGGLTGAVSASNSLVGTSANDRVGISGITVLPNGNYVVSSQNWKSGAATNAGAVTWGSGAGGLTGAVSATNSLIGTSTSDNVSYGGITVLSNGNYVVRNYFWNGSVTAVGAVTWGSGAGGLTGAVSASNSLVGTSANDRVGNTGITALTNGNYVVVSQNWKNGAATSAGAVTWGSGAGGLTGAVSASNSLVGTSASDGTNVAVTALTNGNYVATSAYWKNGTVTNVGAVTWGSGTGGLTGAISTTNSLVGTAASDKVGSAGVTALTNGNYVVRSSAWSNGAATVAGAVTWGSGTGGLTGAVSATNSLVGTTTSDAVGSSVVTALANGNYVVGSYFWRNGSVVNAGAATWGSGNGGLTGAVSASNSLVGTAIGDQVGSTVTALTNGNYVVGSSYWNNGSVTRAGVVTWGSGNGGLTGVVSASNSLVGASANDGVGSTITALTNGNYIVASSTWKNGTAASAGVVTWGSGTGGLTGVVSASNSLVGSKASARFGTVTALGDRFLVSSTTDGTGGRVAVGLTDPSQLTYALASDRSFTLAPSYLTATLNAGTAVVLQASNDITVNSAITANNPAGNGGALTLQAGRSILINADITTDNGNLTLIGNDLLANGVVDAQRDVGTAVIAMDGSTRINAGIGTVTFELRTGAGKTNTASGAITLQDVTAGSLSVHNLGLTAGSGITLNGGSLTLSGGGAALVLAADTGIFDNRNSAGIDVGSGRYLIYSADEATTLLGNLTPGVVNGKTYANYGPGSVTESGNRIIYATSPPPPPPPPPVVVSPPVVVETPVVVSPPVVVEAPVVVSPPVVVETPVVVSPPVVVETPVVVSPPPPPVVVSPPPVQTTTVIGGTSTGGSTTGGLTGGGVVVGAVAPLVTTPPPAAAGSSTGSGAIATTSVGAGAITVQVTASATAGVSGPQSQGQSQGQPEAGGGRMEASVSTGAFQVVYSQPTSALPGTGTGTGSATGSTAAGSGAAQTQGTIAAASSFTTFRADEKPAVAIVPDRNAQGTQPPASGSQANDEKTAE